jgi:predicted metal-dependent HD superfamily phosphohydrolase
MPAWKNWRMVMCTVSAVITTNPYIPIALPAAMRAELEAAYQMPPRAYHSMQHVHEVLAHYSTVAASIGWENPKEVYFAVLFHDAIYQAGRKDNEARSAEWAAAVIKKYLPDEVLDIARIRTLIELTARHGHLRPQELDEDARHFLDCDMAILGAEPVHFLDYDKAIVTEYRGKLPGWMFQFYRRKFLRSLLESPRIYLSELFFHSHEARAKANIQALLNRPRSPLLASSGR